MELRNANGVLEVCRVEVGHGFFEFSKLSSGAVQFDSGDFGDGEAFFDGGRDVLDMTKEGVGVIIGFTAEDGVISDAEIVVKAGFFLAGEVNTFSHDAFEFVHFAFLDFEVRMDADGLGKFAHRESLPENSERARREIFIEGAFFACARGSWRFLEQLMEMGDGRWEMGDLLNSEFFDINTGV